MHRYSPYSFHRLITLSFISSGYILSKDALIGIWVSFGQSGGQVQSKATTGPTYARRSSGVRQGVNGLPLPLSTSLTMIPRLGWHLVEKA